MLDIHTPGTVRTVPLVAPDDPRAALYGDVRLRVRVLSPPERAAYAQSATAAQLATERRPPAEQREAMHVRAVEYLRGTLVGVEGATYGGEPLTDAPVETLIAALEQGDLVMLAGLACAGAQSPTRAEKNS